MPEGLTPQLLTYDRFAEERGWTPRQVDELTRDEIFWLPVIRAARMDASEQVARLDAKNLGAASGFDSVG